MKRVGEPGWVEGWRVGRKGAGMKGRGVGGGVRERVRACEGGRRWGEGAGDCQSGDCAKVFSVISIISLSASFKTMHQEAVRSSGVCFASQQRHKKYLFWWWWLIAASRYVYRYIYIYIY